MSLQLINQLIKLEDGTLVEVEVPGDHFAQINATTAQIVDSNIERINPILVNVSNTVAQTFNEVDRAEIEKAEIELSFNFDITGNVYITKAKAGAALKVKITVKPA